MLNRRSQNRTEHRHLLQGRGRTYGHHEYAIDSSMCVESITLFLYPFAVVPDSWADPCRPQPLPPEFFGVGLQAPVVALGNCVCIYGAISHP